MENFQEWLLRTRVEQCFTKTTISNFNQRISPKKEEIKPVFKPVKREKESKKSLKSNASRPRQGKNMFTTTRILPKAMITLNLPAVWKENLAQVSLVPQTMSISLNLKHDFATFVNEKESLKNLALGTMTRIFLTQVNRTIQFFIRAWKKQNFCWKVCAGLRRLTCVVFKVKTRWLSEKMEHHRILVARTMHSVLKFAKKMLTHAFANTVLTILAQRTITKFFRKVLGYSCRRQFVALLNVTKKIQRKWRQRTKYVQLMLFDQKKAKMIVSVTKCQKVIRGYLVRLDALHERKVCRKKAGRIALTKAIDAPLIIGALHVRKHFLRSSFLKLRELHPAAKTLIRDDFELTENAQKITFNTNIRYCDRHRVPTEVNCKKLMEELITGSFCKIMKRKLKEAEPINEFLTTALKCMRKERETKVELALKAHKSGKPKQVSCGRCDSSMSSVVCIECNIYLCALCSTSIHKRKRNQHHFFSGISFCSFCTLAIADVICISCTNQKFCFNCAEEFHARSKILTEHFQKKINHEFVCVSCLQKATLQTSSGLTYCLNCKNQENSENYFSLLKIPNLLMKARLNLLHENDLKQNSVLEKRRKQKLKLAIETKAAKVILCLLKRNLQKETV